MTLQFVITTYISGFRYFIRFRDEANPRDISYEGLVENATPFPDEYQAAFKMDKTPALWELTVEPWPAKHCKI